MTASDRPHPSTSPPGALLRPDTVAVVAGRPPHDPDEPLNVPVHFASTFVAGGEREYGRYGNPSWSAFEDALGALEGGHCVAFSTGIAAIAAVLDLIEPGGTIVIPRHSYTGTIGQVVDRESQSRLTARYVDITDAASVAEACVGADLLWFESPTNPALEVADIEALARAAHERGARVAVDNTFATPMRQNPLHSGADVVVHSATKYIAGHSDVLMGAVVATERDLAEQVSARRGLGGAIPAPLDAFLALRGLRTLPVRLDRAEQTARELVSRLTGHPRLVEVRYPGSGGIISIVVSGGADAADRVVARTELWIHATSLGGVESTLERRRRWPAEASTIPDGLIRLSVGLENVDDLAADLLAALEG